MFHKSSRFKNLREGHTPCDENQYCKEHGASIPRNNFVATLIGLALNVLCLDLAAQPLLLNERLESNEFILSDYSGGVTPDLRWMTYVKADTETTPCCITNKQPRTVFDSTKRWWRFSNWR